jgi:hypothetical protein
MEKVKKPVKAKAVKSVSVQVTPEEETPVIAQTRLPQIIEGKPIVRVMFLDSGHVAIMTADGVGYTLPRSEYDLLPL